MKEKQSAGFLERMATFIVDKRTLFFLLYIFAARRMAKTDDAQLERVRRIAAREI